MSRERVKGYCTSFLSTPVQPPRLPTTPLLHQSPNVSYLYKLSSLHFTYQNWTHVYAFICLCLYVYVCGQLRFFWDTRFLQQFHFLSFSFRFRWLCSCTNAPFTMQSGGRLLSSPLKGYYLCALSPCNSGVLLPHKTKNCFISEWNATYARRLFVRSHNVLDFYVHWGRSLRHREAPIIHT